MSALIQEDRTENTRSGDALNSGHSAEHSGHQRHHRPSLIGLFSGNNSSFLVRSKNFTLVYRAFSL